MVWGAIGEDGVGPLHRCQGTPNQHKRLTTELFNMLCLSVDKKSLEKMCHICVLVGKLVFQ
jgi:hypothetical protein